MQSLQENLKPAFQRFWERHEKNNRFLWGSRVASLFTRAYIEGHGLDPAAPVGKFLRDHLKGDWRKKINLKHYRGPYTEGNQERPPLNLRHLLEDLDRNKNMMYESLVVFEVRGLELLLNGLFQHIAQYMLASTSVDKGAKGRIEETLKKVLSNERYAVTLNELSGLLPTMRSLLEGSTYKREESPFLSTKVNGISCLDAVQLWKEVRNLIIHHDCLITPQFSRRWSAIFLSVTTDRAQSQRRLSPDSVLSIGLRQAIFCMTTCFQTAVVLYVSSGASTADRLPNLSLQPTPASGRG